MSKEYAPLAARIIELVGGPENINQAFHCQTRLRFALKDKLKTNPYIAAGLGVPYCPLTD